MKRTSDYSVKEEDGYFVILKDRKPMTNKGEVYQKPFVVKYTNREAAEDYVRELKGKSWDRETIGFLYLVR
jgi:hypothetical protein